MIKLARRHNVRINQTPLKVQDPRGLVTELSEIPRAAQLACFEAVVSKLERDIDTLKAQANAWALGDVAALRALPYPKEIEECQSTLESSGDMKQLIAATEPGLEQRGGECASARANNARDPADLRVAEAGWHAGHPDEEGLSGGGAREAPTTN